MLNTEEDEPLVKFVKKFNLNGLINIHQNKVKHNFISIYSNILESRYPFAFPAPRASY